MTELVRGVLTFNELTKKARGGTELIASRMAESLNPDLLKEFQIIHSRVRDLDPALNKIIVLHDLPADPESAKLSDPEFRKQFDKIVCVSDWQLQQYNLIHGLPYSETAVIHNGIYPIEDHVKPNKDEVINLVYHTTPHRGLGILVPVFEQLIKLHPYLRLHVFSSFEIYGWKERDKPYEQLFHTCKHHPNITYYGSVSNEEIREKLKEMHIFAYPSIWPETSCLAAIEAMSAKCLVVAPNYAALPDTCGRWAKMYQWNEDPQKHAEIFFHTLHNVILSYKQNDYSGYLQAQKMYYDLFYNFTYIKESWDNLMRNILGE